MDRNNFLKFIKVTFFILHHFLPVVSPHFRADGLKNGVVQPGDIFFSILFFFKIFF